MIRSLDVILIEVSRVESLDLQKIAGRSAQSYEIDHFFVVLAVLILFLKVLSRKRSVLYYNFMKRQECHISLRRIQLFLFCFMIAIGKKEKSSYEKWLFVGVFTS